MNNTTAGAASTQAPARIAPNGFDTPPPAPPPSAENGAASAADADTEEARFARKTLDELNAERPLGDVFFDYDRARLRDADRRVLQANVEWLNRWSTTRIAVEGHCDERGSAEYNLALGERRALAARDYIVSLGVGANRVRTVSYGKEFPFEPGHQEGAWSKNRRAHFVITAR